jgi:hypothetical protein
MAITAEELVAILEKDGGEAVEEALRGHTRSELMLLSSRFTALVECIEDAETVEEPDDDEDWEPEPSPG